jgi:hypothetical protein
MYLYIYIYPHVNIFCLVESSQLPQEELFLFCFVFFLLGQRWVLFTWHKIFISVAPSRAMLTSRMLLQFIWVSEIFKIINFNWSTNIKNIYIFLNKKHSFPGYIFKTKEIDVFGNLDHTLSYKSRVICN